MLAVSCDKRMRQAKLKGVLQKELLQMHPTRQETLQLQCFSRMGTNGSFGADGDITVRGGLIYCKFSRDWF